MDTGFVLIVDAGRCMLPIVYDVMPYSNRSFGAQYVSCTLSHANTQG